MKHKKALVAGTFDNFHLGHQYLLWQVSNLSENFTIIVARDTTVKKIKNHLAKNNELARKERLELESLPNALVRLGRLDADFFKAIKEENPDVLFLGYDQHFPIKKSQELFPDLQIIRLKSFHPEIFKSSKFLKQ